VTGPQAAYGQERNHYDDQHRSIAWVLHDMARNVGPDGLVTGVDFDPQIVELARQDARDASAGNSALPARSCR